MIWTLNKLGKPAKFLVSKQQFKNIIKWIRFISVVTKSTNYNIYNGDIMSKYNVKNLISQ